MTAAHQLTAALARHSSARPLARCLAWTLKNLAGLAGGTALACALLFMPSPAQAISDDAMLRRMDAVLEENARLHDEAWKARKNGRDAAKQAEDAANASDERLERTRIEALAHVGGVSPAQVESLRKDGKSWGQAAGELGVHPGFLGIGKAPLYKSLPTAKAPDKTGKTGKPDKTSKTSKTDKKTEAKGKTGKQTPEKVQAKGKRGVEKTAPAAKTAKKSAKAAPAKKTTSDKKPKKSKQKP